MNQEIEALRFYNNYFLQIHNVMDESYIHIMYFIHVLRLCINLSNNCDICNYLLPLNIFKSQVKRALPRKPKFCNMMNNNHLQGIDNLHNNIKIASRFFSAHCKRSLNRRYREHGRCKQTKVQRKIIKHSVSRRWSQQNQGFERTVVWDRICLRYEYTSKVVPHRRSIKQVVGNTNNLATHGRSF